MREEELARYDIDGTGKWGVAIALACGAVVLGACVVLAFVVRDYFWWWIGAGVVVFLGFGISTKYAREWRAGKSFVLMEDRVVIVMADSRREILFDEIQAVVAELRVDESGPMVFYELLVGEEVLEIGCGQEVKGFAVRIAKQMGREIVRKGKHWMAKWCDPWENY
jgi:hypothetical protein